MSSAVGVSDAQQKLGTFGSPSYTTIGDEYDKKADLDSRFKGKGMYTSPGKKGQGNGTFEREVKSLHEGDKYVDPGFNDRKGRVEKEKKKITPEGFRYTSPSKRGGNGYGLLSPPAVHATEFDVLQKGELPAKSKPEMKNITTSPAKKGTFGTPGVTIGNNLPYLSDPYDAERKRELQEARDATRRVVGPPFKSAVMKKDLFNSNIYGIDRALPAKRPSKLPPISVPTQPWRPTAPAKRGHNCTINRYPEYKEDPMEMKEARARAEREKTKPSTVWKPISGMKSTPCRAIPVAA